VVYPSQAKKKKKKKKKTRRRSRIAIIIQKSVTHVHKESLTLHARKEEKMHTILLQST
jgi:hypothetical protein